MAGFKWKSVITGLVVLGAIAANGNQAQAQWSTSIAAGELLRPWEQHLAVMQSLSVLISAVDGAQAGARLTENLAALETDIGEFGLEIEKFVYRLAGDPQFVYVAAETSQELGTLLARVHVRFDSLYLALGVHEREDVIAAQASLDSLRKIMDEKIKFENDVTNALGSGSRQQIMGVANRWWIGKEKSVEVQKFAEDLRQQFEGVTANKE